MRFSICRVRDILTVALILLTLISMLAGCIGLYSEQDTISYTNNNVIQMDYEYTVFKDSAIFGHMEKGQFILNDTMNEESVYTIKLEHLRTLKYKDPAIGLTTAHCGILVYNGTELLYTFLGSGHQLFDYYGERRNSIIQLGIYDENVPLEIQFIVPAGYTFEIYDLVFGDTIALEKYFNRDGLLKIYLTGTLILISIIWFVASLFFKKSDGKFALLSFSMLSFAICVLIFANLRTHYFNGMNSMWRLDCSLFVLCQLPSLILFFLHYNHDFRKEHLLVVLSNLSFIPVILFIFYELFSSFLGNVSIASMLQTINLFLSILLLISITLYVAFNISSSRSYARPLVFALALLTVAIITSIYDLFFEIEHSYYVTPVIFTFIISMGILTFQALKMSVESISSNTMKKNLMIKVYTDPMTMLLNRAAFDEKVSNREKDRTRYLVMSFDLNGLKMTNDRFGHDVGDRLIKNFADALQKATYSLSANSFRVGGDEFVILIESDGKEDAEKIIEAIRENFQPKEMSYNSFSCGYTYCGPNDSLFDKYKEADEKMYYNKQNYKRGERL